MSIKPLAAPTGGPRKNNGNERKQRGKRRPPEPPCTPGPPRPKFSSRVKRPPPGPSPRVPGATSGDSFDQSRQEGGPALPIPTPSLNVSPLICRCRQGAGEKRGCREHQSPWHRTWSTAPSRGFAPLPAAPPAPLQLHPEPLGSP